MAWFLVKNCREVLVVFFAEAGFAIMLGGWVELLLFVQGLAYILALKVSQEKGWKQPAESPITKLFPKFQGKDGVPMLLLLVCLPVLFASMLVGWGIRKFCGW